ncbi:protein of unknown function [Burkholderia multivorans]
MHDPARPRDGRTGVRHQPHTLRHEITRNHEESDMTVRQAGAPVSDDELYHAAAGGMSRRLAPEFPSDPRVRMQCRFYPKLSFFFDGTGNNLYQELQKPEHEQALSNVAKLYLAAIDDRMGQGATPTYIPGVGTPFQIPRRIPGYFAELLRDDRGGAAGLGLGVGGRMRIDAALAELEMILGEDWSPGTHGICSPSASPYSDFPAVRPKRARLCGNCFRGASTRTVSGAGWGGTCSASRCTSRSWACSTRWRPWAGPPCIWTGGPNWRFRPRSSGACIMWPHMRCGRRFRSIRCAWTGAIRPTARKWSIPACIRTSAAAMRRMNRAAATSCRASRCATCTRQRLRPACRCCRSTGFLQTGKLTSSSRRMNR